MEISSLGSQPNNKKYGENDAREAYRLNLYPMANHGNYMSQFLVRPFWKPYLHNPHFIICTIHLANHVHFKMVLWRCEVVWWSINVFSHNFWNFPQNFAPWLVRTSIGAPNLLNILCKNAYATPSLLRFNNTNSNHLEKSNHNQDISIMSRCQI